MKKLVILLGVLGVSFSAVFVRLSAAPAMALVFLRMLFAAGMLLPWSLLRQRQEWRAMTRRELGLSLVSGVFLGLHFVCYFSALGYTSIAVSVVLVDTEVFFVALGGLALLRQPVSPMGWAGIAVTFLGSVVIALGGGSGGSDPARGCLLSLLGAACMAVYTMIGAAVRRTRSTTLYTALVYASGAGTVGLMLLVTGTPVLGWSPGDYLCALGLAVCCTLLGHSVFSWGLRYESAAYVSTVKLLEPVFATVLGILLFREIPGPREVLGGLLVLAGILWYTLLGTRGTLADGT